MPANAGISRDLATPPSRRTMQSMSGGWTYIMTNKPDGVLYTGVTAHLAQRVDQHKRGVGSAYCRKYNLTRLVHAEPHDCIEDAIRREKMLKAWKRAWKVKLVEANNPGWDDLFNQIAG